MRSLLGILLIIVIFLLFSEAKKCTEPRPTVCTEEDSPVCALHSNGYLKTFSNSCIACSNPTVVQYS